MRIPGGCKYCALCDSSIAEFAWEKHTALHEERGEIVGGKCAAESLRLALYMRPGERQQYRREVVDMGRLHQ